MKLPKRILRRKRLSYQGSIFDVTVDLCAIRKAQEILNV